MTHSWKQHLEVKLQELQANATGPLITLKGIYEQLGPQMTLSPIPGHGRRSQNLDSTQGTELIIHIIFFTHGMLPLAQ